MVRRRVLRHGAMDCVGQEGGLARVGVGDGVERVGVGDGVGIIGVRWEEGRGEMVKGEVGLSKKGG